jgi:hypothetical protein
MSEERPVITVNDIRLQRLLFRGADLASLSEYAEKSDMGISEVIANLEPFLDGRTLEIEAYGSDLFLHTAPSGRPQPQGIAIIPSNLWEILRQVGDTQYAAMLFSIIRGLQFAGWRCKTHSLDANNPATFLELNVNNVWSPLFVYPKINRISVKNGILDKISERKILYVTLIVHQKEAQQYIAEVKRWFVNNNNDLTVVILQEPSYQPIVVTGNDTAVKPKTIKYK